jgi:hypothetical protein
MTMTKNTQKVEIEAIASIQQNILQPTVTNAVITEFDKLITSYSELKALNTENSKIANSLTKSISYLIIQNYSSNGDLIDHARKEANKNNASIKALISKTLRVLDYLKEHNTLSITNAKGEVTVHNIDSLKKTSQDKINLNPLYTECTKEFAGSSAELIAALIAYCRHSDINLKDFYNSKMKEAKGLGVPVNSLLQNFVTKGYELIKQKAAEEIKKQVEFSVNRVMDNISLIDIEQLTMLHQLINERLK